MPSGFAPSRPACATGLRSSASTIKDREEQIGAHGRAADELREEIDELRDELASARTVATEASETLAARDRQLARAQEDIARLRDDMDDVNRQLMSCRGPRTTAGRSSTSS